MQNSSRTRNKQSCSRSCSASDFRTACRHDVERNGGAMVLVREGGRPMVEIGREENAQPGFRADGQLDLLAFAEVKSRLTKLQPALFGIADRLGQRDIVDSADPALWVDMVRV